MLFAPLRPRLVGIGPRPDPVLMRKPPFTPLRFGEYAIDAKETFSRRVQAGNAGSTTTRCKRAETNAPDGASPAASAHRFPH
jgi:hypothetical protein